MYSILLYTPVHVLTAPILLNGKSSWLEFERPAWFQWYSSWHWQAELVHNVHGTLWYIDILVDRPLCRGYCMCMYSGLYKACLICHFMLAILVLNVAEVQHKRSQEGCIIYVYIWKKIRSLCTCTLKWWVEPRLDYLPFGYVQYSSCYVLVLNFGCPLSFFSCKFCLAIHVCM